MPIAAPAPPQLPTAPPVPAQVSTAFARQTQSQAQDWFEAVRAAPALNAPSLVAPAQRQSAVAQPAPVASTPVASTQVTPEAAAQTLSKVAPSRMAKMWDAIQRRLPQAANPAPAKAEAKAAAKDTAPLQFSKVRASQDGFKNAPAPNPADNFAGQTSSSKATPAPAARHTPVSPARSLTEGQAPLRQAPSLWSQVRIPESAAQQPVADAGTPVTRTAAPLQGTTPRTPQDWGATPRRAPDIHAPVKAIDIPLDRTQPPGKSPALYVPLNSVIDAQQPDKLIGSSINTSVPLGADSPILPGGKLVIKAANVDTTRPGEIRSPQIDILAVDKAGGAQGHIRVNRDTNVVTGSIHVGDGRRDLVFTGTANPVNGAATAVQVTGVSDTIGLRIVVNNPGGAQTPAGKPGAQGKRVEVLATPGGGGFVRNGPNLRKAVEVYVFAAKSGTPGSAATSSSEGAGVRFSDLNISPKGDVPVVGTAQIEVARQHGTTTRGQPIKGDGQLGVTVSADLKIGKDGGIQGFVEPSVTVNPAADRPFSLSGFLGILIPLR